jgi:hypothetical protein
MNYIIEDDFDFYGELNMALTKPSEVLAKPGIATAKPDIATSMCLISHEPLTYNAVTLPCSHQFNYMPLYTELNLLPKPKVICPYCRLVSDKLLPFIPLPSVSKIIGINQPEKHCLPAPACAWQITHGPNKGNLCGVNGLEAAHGTYCLNHATKIKLMGANNDEWTPEMATLYKTHTVVALKKLLRAKSLNIGGTKKELVKRLLSI